MDRQLSFAQGVLATVVGVTAIGLVAAALMPAHSTSGPAVRTACLSNLKQAATAQIMYLGDYDDRWPDASRWVDLTLPYTKSIDVYRCSVLKAPDFGYGMAAALSGKKMSPSTAPTTVLLYESSDLRRNAHGAPTSLPGRHKGMSNVAYADGHVKAMAPGVAP